MICKRCPLSKIGSDAVLCCSVTGEKVEELSGCTRTDKWIEKQSEKDDLDFEEEGDWKVAHSWGWGGSRKKRF